MSVTAVLGLMRKKGLRSAWEFCIATKFHDLIFCDSHEDTENIEARKDKSGWSFFTISGQKL